MASRVFSICILYNSGYLYRYKLLHALHGKRITGNRGRVLAVKLMSAKPHYKMGKAISLVENKN